MSTKRNVAVCVFALASAVGAGAAFYEAIEGKKAIEAASTPAEKTDELWNDMQYVGGALLLTFVMGMGAIDVAFNRPKLD